MNATFEIHYKGSSQLMQRASFPLKGKRPEFVAYQWWQHIRKEMSYHVTLEQVIVNGDQDITQMVLDMEAQVRKNVNNIGDLPF